MIKPKIAFIDPGSFGLPYDRCFLNAIINEVDVDFFIQKQNIASNRQKNLIRELIAANIQFLAPLHQNYMVFLSYCYLLLKLFKNKNHYQYIHFNWSLFQVLIASYFQNYLKKTYIFSS